MKAKLIKRAAIKYRNWILSQMEIPSDVGETTIINLLDSMNRRTKLLQQWCRKFSISTKQKHQRSTWDKTTHLGIQSRTTADKIATGIIPDIGSNITEKVNQIVEMFQNLSENKTFVAISLKEAIEEITVISETWDRVELKKSVLSVLIKNVVLNDENQEVELGAFWIRFNLDYPLGKIIIQSSDQIKSSSGYVHPHIQKNNETLCMGDGNSLATEALCQGRLEDYFLIIETVLKTYNSESSYVELSEWYNPNHDDEFFCEQCDEWRSNDINYYCEECETNYCDGCSDSVSIGCCIECGEWRCSDCSITCSDCEEKFCNNCCGSCANCGDSTCSSCLDTCIMCSQSFCGSCLKICEDCGDKICNHCIDECGFCKQERCTNCINSQTCSDCGTGLCKSCSEEHNCLLSEVENK